MALEPREAFRRSVDSIQAIYAVVIALAISQAIQSLLRDPNGSTDLSWPRLSSGFPALVAFLVTLVPFWHGMNRHLDRCYLEKSTRIIQGALLFDFGTFFVEASFLFAAAWSLRFGIETFDYLGGLLIVDMLWAFVSHQIHFAGEKSHAIIWSTINIVALALGVFVVSYPFGAKPLVLMAIFVLRTIADYTLCWRFYFPLTSAQESASA